MVCSLPLVNCIEEPGIQKREKGYLGFSVKGFLSFLSRKNMGCMGIILYNTQSHIMST